MLTFKCEYDILQNVKRTDRLTRRRETPQTERPGSREVKSLDIDKFILLDRAEARKLVKNIRHTLSNRPPESDG